MSRARSSSRSTQQHLGPGLGQGVARLAADALSGADDDHAPAVHAQHGRIVGDLGVVRTRHRSSGTLVRCIGQRRSGRTGVSR